MARWSALFAALGSSRKVGLVLAAAIVTATTLATVRLVDPWFVAIVREWTFDAYQRQRPRPFTDLPVRIVDIDEASLAAFGQWPWPRTRIAELTERLKELGATVVAFDVIFAEADRLSPARVLSDTKREDPDFDAARAMLARLPDNDEVFAAAIKSAPVVLGFATVASAGQQRPPVRAGFAFAGGNPTTILDPFVGTAMSLPALNAAATGLGSVSLNAGETGGVIRRLPLLFTDGKQVYPGLALETLRVALGASTILVRSTGASGESELGAPSIVGLRVGDLQVPLTSRGELWLYYDKNRAERFVSVKDVLDPTQDAEVRSRIDGQVVFVGTSAVGLLDNRLTALGEEVPGVAMHAQAVEQIIGQQFLLRPDWADGLEISASVLIPLFMTTILLFVGPQFSFVVGGIVSLFIAGGSWYAFSSSGLLIDPLFPSFSGAAVYVLVNGVMYISSDRERRFVRQAFSQYLAPELLARLEKAPGSMKLGGDIREITVMFMDVRGFTPISEKLSATQLIEFLNILFSPLSEAIQEELGTIDKYIGDSIMAFWNAPLDIPDHPTRACRAGLKMLAAVREMTAADAFGFRAAGIAGLEVKIGIGLSTGEACVGNMGSARRFNYSAVGDTVNTAARIESSCKAVGAALLISEETARHVRSFAILEAGEIALKGKSRPAKLFALLGDEAFAATPAFQELARYHRELIDALASQNHALAAQALEHCRSVSDDEVQPLYDRYQNEISALEPAKHVA